MTMYKLTTAEKTEKLRQNYARNQEQEPVTKCASCIHRNDHPLFCRPFAPVGGENKAGFLIVVSCDGYERNG